MRDPLPFASVDLLVSSPAHRDGVLVLLSAIAFAVLVVASVSLLGLLARARNLVL
jgi:hypothetical protein